MKKILWLFPIIINLSLASLAFGKTNILLHEHPIAIPEIHFLDQEKKPHLFEEFEGNLLLVNFWATWCSPCIAEFKSLDQLQKDYRKQKFKIIALSEDFKSVDTIKEFYKNEQIKYLDIYIDEKNKIFSATNIVGLPTSLLLNAEGKEIIRFSGMVDWHDPEFRKIIDKELAKAL